MSPKLFFLVLSSAILHALWNFAARRLSGNLGAIWLGTCFAAAACAPFALGAIRSGPPLGPGLRFVLATGALQSLYFIVLAKAYETGEISTVYPIARGTGVAGVALASRVLLGEAVSRCGAAGIAAICGGIVALGWPKTESGTESIRLPGARTAPVPWAAGTGLLIVAYSVVDKLGVRLVPPVVYVFGMFAVSAVLLAPYVRLKHAEQCAGAWRDLKKDSAFIGLSAMGTYLVILFAFRLGPLGYIVAVREFAVVIGSALGVLFLGEPLGARKGLGIAAIAAGLILIKAA